MSDLAMFNVEQYSQQAYDQSLRGHMRRAPGANPAALRAWRDSLQARVQQALGLTTMPLPASRVPLASLVVHRREHPGYVEEKIYVESEAGVTVPFYLLLPSKAPEGAGFPLVLALHGHHPHGMEPFVGHYQDAEEAADVRSLEGDVGIQAVARGYAVLVPELRGFGELATDQDRSAGKKNSCLELSRRALLLGRTLIGERVWDVVRVLDYATQRPELDLTRISVVGFSGGGTAAMYLAALDSRIAAAALVSSFCTYRDSILALSHCPCNIIPGIVQLGEMSDLAGLIAPRPLLVVHGGDDRIYPYTATQEAFRSLAELYEYHQATGRCWLVEGEGGHRFYADPVWAFVSRVFSAEADDVPKPPKR